MKKNILSPIFYLTLCLLGLSGCESWSGIKGEGSIVTETRTATKFKTIQLLTSADVQVVKSDTTYSVEVSDYANIVKYISVKVTSNNLIISTSPASTILENSNAKVIVTMPDALESVTITGSGNVDVDAVFAPLHTLALSGSGSINVNDTINVAKLATTIMGSGSITAKGNVKALTAINTGSGNMMLANLKAKAASCAITASGNAYVNVTDSLKATITGSGNIEYSGSPLIISTITGSGKLIQK